MALAVKTTSDGAQWISKRDLEEEIFGGQIPETEQCRRYFGKALTPSTIESVVRAAELGYMRDLSDLIAETIFIDPHLGSIIGKRFRSLAAMQPKVVPASGDGIDASRANFYADLVRQQLAWLPMLPQAILRLNWAHCHGRAALEKVWKENRGGKVQWRIDSLNWIHQRRLSFGPERELRVRDDLFNGYGFEKRGLALRDFPHKFIEFTPQLFNEYPEREGFGPRCLYFSFFKRFDWRERMILLEVFGKPWRIVFIEDPSKAQKDMLDDAQQQVDRLGANSTARLGAGIGVKTDQPGKGAGDIHKDVAAECDDQNSKLVLGQTRTTDAKADGLGGAQAFVMQDEQILVVSADGWNIGPCLTEGLSTSLIEVNFGSEEVSHAPTIKLEFELPPDREKETKRAKDALSTGVAIKEEEFYEAIGFSIPEPGDKVITQAPASPAPGGFGAPAAPAPTLGIQPGEPANDQDGGASPTGDPAATGGETPAVPLAAARKARRLRLLQSSATGSSER